MSVSIAVFKELGEVALHSRNSCLWFALAEVNIPNSNLHGILVYVRTCIYCFSSVDNQVQLVHKS